MNMTTKGWHGTASAGSRLPRLHIPVRPAQYETPSSYLRRICVANGADPAWIGGLARSRRQASKDPAEVGRVIAELGGPDHDHWAVSHARASLGLDGVSAVGDAYSRRKDGRMACLSCTGHQAAATYDHIRFGFCLRHRRWVGPGVTEQTQRLGRMDAEQHAAERAARRLVSRGLVKADLYETAWQLTRDWTYMTGAWPERLRTIAATDGFTREVDDRIALYPDTVSLLRLVTGASFTALLDVERGGATQRRAFLHEALRWLPIERWIVAEGIEEWVEDRERRGAVPSTSREPAHCR